MPCYYFLDMLWAERFLSKLLHEMIFHLILKSVDGAFTLIKTQLGLWKNNEMPWCMLETAVCQANVEHRNTTLCISRKSMKLHLHIGAMLYIIIESILPLGWCDILVSLPLTPYNCVCNFLGLVGAMHPLQTIRLYFMPI